MRNSHSDSQLESLIKKEVNMGDYDEHTSDNSSRQNSVAQDPTDITKNPLTDEEFQTLEQSLQGGGILSATNPRYEASSILSNNPVYQIIISFSSNVV
jgi:hypothetical protein